MSLENDDFAAVGITHDDAPVVVAELESTNASAEASLAPPPASPMPETVGDVMTEEEFALFMSHSFALTGGIVGVMYPPPLQSLTNAGNLPTARPAFNVLYQMALDFSWMRWLISKEAAWVKDMMALGAFGSQLAQAIGDELRARQPHPQDNEAPPPAAPSMVA